MDSPLIGVGDALFAGRRGVVAGLKVEGRGDAAERAVAPRATNGVAVEGGMRLEFGFGEVAAIKQESCAMHSESLQPDIRLDQGLCFEPFEAPFLD